MENTPHTTSAPATTTTTTTTAAAADTAPVTPNPHSTLPTSIPQTQAQNPLPAQIYAQTPTQPQLPTLSFREKLDAGEEHWLWKLSLRILLLVVAVIGTGCVGWAVQTAQSEYYGYFEDDQYFLSWALITFGISIVWTLICILVLLLRRPPRPVHPGVAVGMDLILWLAYIPTTLFAVAACITVLHYGTDDFFSNGSSSYYNQAANGTWVYNPTGYGAQRACDSNSTSTTTSSSRSRYNSYLVPPFATCAEQDAWVNALWAAGKRRVRVELTGVVCQGLAFILHFALFVWACVDTHRRNKRKTSGDAEKLAADIIGRMVRDGAIIQPPGMARMQGGYQQLGQGQGYQGGWQQQQQPYTVHYGPPPPLPQQQQQQLLNQQHPVMRGARGPAAPVHQIVEHYGNEKGGRGLGGPGPVSRTPPSPLSPLPSPPPPQQQQTQVAEHYNEKAAPGHAI
ncbi:hypothetical protein K505DRAFT_305042 [Melanomma pulvis-pyrius CBS 109.77]|uniref:Uncharacterized protein n=1 Tax=Melanomma pulvis-pyrius CBS 109.77 TaxID=1314802 RepID=A0A6A6XD44_9PLEO|nr:hypothetical protein K505DRAFT_305042 [Melanomma pulvis-pyrius CBS 109.77]